MKLAIGYWNVIVDGVEKKPETREEFIQALKDLREVLLKESDWMMGFDSPLTEEQKQEWATWRTYMRNLPSTITSSTVITPDFEITDPPIAYRPKSWVNVDYDVVDAIFQDSMRRDAERIAAMEGHTEESASS